MSLDVRIASPHENLANLIADELRPHFAVLIELSASARYALRIRPGVDASDLLAHLAPLAPPIEVVPALDVLFELHLDDPAPFERWNLSVRGDHPETEALGDTLVSDVGVSRHIAGHEIKRDYHLDRPVLEFGGAPEVVRHVVMWRAAKLGLGRPSERKPWNDNDRDLFLYVVDPELARLPRRERPQIHIACDDTSAAAPLVAQLAAAGYRAQAALVNGLTDFSLRGAAFVDDERGLDRSELRMILQSFLDASGVARDSHPLLIDETPMRPSATGSMRISLPLEAYRRGTLRPWHGDVPARFRVRLHTDRRAKVEGLAKRLREAGFERVSIFDRTRPEAGPLACLRTLRDAPATFALLRDALAAEAPAGVPQPNLGAVDAVWEARHLPSDVDLHLPFDGLSTEIENARVRALLKRRGQHISIVTRDGHAPPELLAALAELGLKVSRRRDPSETDCIRCGGAPLELLAAVQGIVKGAIGIDLPVDREWPSFDDDVWIVLGPETMSAWPSSGKRSRGPAETWDTWLRGTAESEARAFVEVTASFVRVGETRLERVAGARGAMVPELASFERYCLDATTAATLEHVARSVDRSEPCLLEGPTSTSKTSSILYLAALLGQPVMRLSLNGQTDTGELVGRFAPGPGGWCFREGAVVRALREGWWLVLDELNLAEPQVLERLNPVLERPPALVLTEHDDSVFGPGGTPVHPRFRIFGTMNPAEYVGRVAMSPAWRDRWLGYRQVSSPAEGDYHSLVTFLATGAQPALRLRGHEWFGATASAPFPALAAQRASEPTIGPLLEQLARFHAGLEAAASGQTQALGSGRKERYVFTRRSVLAVIEHIDQRLTEGESFVLALRSAIDRYYLQRLAAGADRKLAQRLLAAGGLGPTGLTPQESDAMGAPGASDASDAPGAPEPPPPFIRVRPGGFSRHSPAERKMFAEARQRCEELEREAHPSSEEILRILRDA